MLTEQEFEEVTSLRLKGVGPSDSFGPVLAEYERITGPFTITDSPCMALPALSAVDH